MIKWQQQFIHKSNFTWLQILVYQKLVTEQVTDDTEVDDGRAEGEDTSCRLETGDCLIRDFLMVVTFEEMSEEKQCFHHHL